MVGNPDSGTGSRFLLRATVGLLLVMLLSLLAAMPADAQSRSSVTDIAHRGSSGAAPENTLSAVELALAQKASFVEIDVQRSADGELVVVHDITLERTTNVEEVFPERAPYRVSDFTLEELKRLDAGSWFSADFAGEEIPTLREVIDAMNVRSGLLLEVKSPALYPGIERDIARELESVPGYLNRALASDRLVVQSFDIGSMRTYHEIQPQVPIGLLYGYRPTDAQLIAASKWAEQINPSFRVTDQSLVDRVQELGMTISVYTINSGQLMREYIDLGVDGIITNYPQVLRDILYNGRANR